MIDVHYTSLISQGVQRVFYRDGHPSRYQPCPTGLNFGEQTGTGVFPLVIAVPLSEVRLSPKERSFNINSLGNKFGEVMEWIQAFDILTIQETKLDKSFPDSQFAVDGYNMFRRDRKKGGGGIMVYIRKSIPSHRIRVKSNEVEVMLIDIQLGQQYTS